MVKVKDFVKAVDTFRKKEKCLQQSNTDNPEWSWDLNNEVARLKIPIVVNYEQHGHFLVIKFFPNDVPIKFTILVTFDSQAIDRLDFGVNQSHNNGFHDFLPYQVNGSHWHSWELNRDHIRSINSPFKLPYAEEFSNIREYDAILRWYCKQNGIILTAHNLELPYRGLLI